MKMKDIILKNQYYEYAMYITEDGKLCHNYFLPATYSDKPCNKERVRWMYPYEVVLATNYEGEMGCHVGNREYFFETSHDLVFKECVRENDTTIIKMYNEKLSLEVQLCYENFDDSPDFLNVNFGYKPFKYLICFLISMVPLIELRGGVPIAVGFGLDYFTALFVCVIGNMLPVPIIYFFARKVLLWGCDKPYIGNFFTYCIEKGNKGGEKLKAKSGRGLF